MKHRTPVTDTDKLRKMIRAVREHFHKGRSKADIGYDFGKNQTEVDRLLMAAIDTGIADVVLRPRRVPDLEEAIRSTFSVREAVVVRATGDDVFDRESRGEAAARYFEEHVESGMKIGISGGYTLDWMCRAIDLVPGGLEFYPAGLVGRGPDIVHVDPFVLITELWHKSGRHSGAAHYVTVVPFERNDSEASADAVATRLASECATLRQRKKVADLYTGMRSVGHVVLQHGPGPHHPGGSAVHASYNDPPRRGRRTR